MDETKHRGRGQENYISTNKFLTRRCLSNVYILLQTTRLECLRAARPNLGFYPWGFSRSTSPDVPRFHP